MSEESLLKKLVSEKEFEKAKVYIERQRKYADYNSAEGLVYEVLLNEKHKIREKGEVPQDLIDLVLSVFLETKEKHRHGIWVHSLSHFTEYLWKIEQYGWIQKFNQAAFLGAIERKDASCCNRLIHNFVVNDRWDLKLEDFHLTPENLIWLKWPNCEIEDYDHARLNVGNFEDEISYLRWQLTEPTFVKFYNLQKIQEIIEGLVALGENEKELKEFEIDLLSKELERIKVKLADEKQEYMIERYQEKIKGIANRLNFLKGGKNERKEIEDFSH